MDKINKSLAIEKGLIVNDNKEKYDELVKFYKYLLEYYINTKIDLSKYEDNIKNSNLYIGYNEKYKNLNEYFNNNYIFLINNLFVEKLSTSDIDLILNKFDKNNIDSELLNIIDKTYKDIIYDNYINGEYKDVVYKLCYGNFAPTNVVNNNSLVFMIVFGKNLIDLEDDKFIELTKKQYSFFEKLINELKEEVFSKLNITCDIILKKEIK